MHVVFQTHNGGELWLGGIAAAGNIATLLDNGITGILSAASSPPAVKDHRLDRLWNIGWDRSHDQLVTAQGAGSLLDSSHLGRRPQRQEGACELQEWSSPQCYGDGDVVDGLEPGER